MVVAVLILLAEALLTGALHMDALAATADGFGGGRTRDDVLRIMRDHAIGSYGATALILLFAMKANSISALISRTPYSSFQILAPALGRWNIVLLPMDALCASKRSGLPPRPYTGTRLGNRLCHLLCCGFGATGEAWCAGSFRLWELPRSVSTAAERSVA
jgi:cobalamin synthase